VLGKGGDEQAVSCGRTLDAALRRYLTRERPDTLTQPGDPLSRACRGLFVYGARPAKPVVGAPLTWLVFDVSMVRLGSAR
jgi:hypothetical protein